ncbi:SET domain-containing protein [Wolfiporia cocos MD-104 SS10]|uniref:Histone-lysine N-methyltransferase, H3 lysine-36 specific n=1 Tax=Wolfiporia cocos (strain MD-104) TaxID=742152 RepID=A0A2H3JLM5_WOLCO|nr:SET domain-containing protein [Wolfiporia cocos MD-104 SS10]
MLTEASHSSRSASADLKTDPNPSATATPPAASRQKSNGARKSDPQLIGHLPRAEEAAQRTFIEIPENHYQYSTLGRSREALESMTCDCQYEHGVDDPDVACGHHSDCINRLTQVECLPDDCRCRAYCQNQRFQRKEYAAIEIVQTEKKGFGLRAAADLPKDTFIYEYLGDVVSQPSFLKRMRQYAEEGIRHFYFMMLQKDEFIDATKRGGIGRFANHSCSPNCYVAKWTVGQHVRMGIFANRNIKKDEELTFNYNVDRYGHDAQPCYCGEPNCVGFIGGKTQTDIAAMDDLYLDALGISEEVATLGLKGSKKKKSKKLDEDFVPTLKPLVEKDVPKVVQAMRQTQSRKVLFKLLMRIKLTEDQSALRQIMRLRGFSVMTNILDDYATDVEMCTLENKAIECMMTWPLIQRNKVEDSKVNVPVQACTNSTDEALAELAKKLLAQWDNLEYAYRIPKRLKAVSNVLHHHTAYPLTHNGEPSRPSKRSRYDVAFFEQPRPQFKRPIAKRFDDEYTFAPLTMDDQDAIRRANEEYDKKTRHQRNVAAVIAQAQAQAAAAAAEFAAAEVAKEEKKDNDGADSAARKKSRHKKLGKEEKEKLKEKRLLKLVGAVVVKCMSKYQKQMDHEHFKKHAKELTHIIAEKEKKSVSYKEGRLDSLSEEKVTKIKKFAKEYIAKILRKLEKAGQRRPPDSSGVMTASTSASAATPDDVDADAEGDISLQSVMPDLDGDGDADADGDEEMADESFDPPDSVSPQEGAVPPATPVPEERSRPVVAPITDPRLRHRNEECGWDPSETPNKLGVRASLSALSVGS